MSAGIESQAANFIIHHVGGRSGSRSFPVLAAFEEDMVNVLYDADESCLSQVTERWKAKPSKTLVLPRCLSSEGDTCDFHVNYDPYTSSIFPMNSRYAQYYYLQQPPGYDYMLGDAYRTVRTLKLATSTLDAVVLDERQAPSPDFLSIDTQGSELSILAGASALLDETILAVQVEVEFQPLYEGQPLFGEIYEFLIKHDFDLVNVHLFPKRHPIRGKHGFRGEGYVTDGEALFFKRPEAIAAKADGRRALQLNKLAFIATVYGRFECAQQCFEMPGFKHLAPLRGGTAEGNPRYLEFISRLAHAVESLPKRSVPLFSERFSCEQSQARFQPEGMPRRSRVRRRLAAIGPLFSAVQTFRAMVKVSRFVSGRLRAYGRTVAMHARWLLRRPASPVEAVFLEFDMKEQFLLASKNRIQDAQL